ncbi:Fe-Mn family superoxide dismutase [Nannocystis sp. SCPEA4]|uniref:superoxide dismutase n=1 Tax=Nannocystis sp. SCPEA4 TaxID=2996787 RepID=UPI00226D450C|nr:Fe-Mn family superoxide dismutase [Nannocystis sp. SCPEA4]MCY1058495.1 superoxide dismutase [Nannocystis sp. SCPEA4]
MTKYTPIEYKPKDYAHLRGLVGITDEQIEVHLKLYKGYVSRTNALFTRVADLSNDGKTGDSCFQELKRRAGWEWDGMRLHEYYFDALKPKADDLRDDNAFAKKVIAQFGSIDAWKADLVGVAKMPGVGWALTYLDPHNGQIWNHWVEQHQNGQPAGARLLLALDVWEHAFAVYRKPLPPDRAAYIDDFFANVDWKVVAGRVA